METLDQYNQHFNFYSLIEHRIANGPYTMFKEVVDKCYFIDFVLHNNTIARTVESLVNQITDAVTSGKKNMFFDCPGEGTITILISKAHEVAEIIKTIHPEVNCYFITGAADGPKSYMDWCYRKNLVPTLIMVPCHYFESFTNDLPTYRTNYEIVNRPKNYVCFNRAIRPHRIELLDRLIEQNLVNNKCYYSLYDGDQSDGGISQILRYNRFSNVINDLDFVRTLRLNVDPDRTNPVDIRLDDLQYYDNSYFSVITETIYYDGEDYRNKIKEHIVHEKCIFLSEKVYKPMAMLHPFVLVASANTLQVLHERGFKTFHPYIDETYDTIEDDDERMVAIVNEIQRLSNQTDEEWLSWCMHIKPIVEHNQKRIYDQSYPFLPEDLIGSLNVI